MQLKVIYIDDEPELAELFAEEFSTDQIDIKVFSTLSTIIEDIERISPDLIFIDYRLSGTTGDKIAKKIKKPVPIVLLTGELTVETTFKFEKIFYKPYNFNEINDFLNTQFHQKT